jgi:hypothetical protein
MLVLPVSSCTEKHDGWKQVLRLETTENNITYTFPATIGISERQNAINECALAIKHSLDLIQEAHFNDSMNIEFLATRREMFKYTGMAASGMAFPETRTMFCVIGTKEKPPLQHELMHMIAMLKWRKPQVSSTWMNEGLATLAENNCNGYTVEQIYSYLSEKKLLISIDSLAGGFYGQPEMIAYHQSAYVVQWLIDNYGIQKFRALWAEGFPSFDRIYGNSFVNVQIGMEKTIREHYPSPPEINWPEFLQGCK